MSLRDALLFFALLAYSNTGLTAATGGNCNGPAKWNVTVDQSSLGASQHRGPESVRDCLAYCVRTTGCLAADVQISVFPPGCFLHFNASHLSASNTYFLSGTIQYRLIAKCSTHTPACTEHEWEKYYGYAAVGATEFVGPRTIRQCLAYCENNVNCFGVDIDVNVVPLRCWPHLDRTNLQSGNVYAQPSTIHYRLMKRCNTTTTTEFACYNPEWRVFENQSSFGAIQYPGARSVQECLDYCGRNSSCKAADVDLNQQPPTCWPHFSDSALQQDNVSPRPGVNQYRLTQRCINTTTGGHCRESVWKLVRGQTALGGSHYVGPRTIQQCLDRCSNTTSCVAVDIDVDVVPLRCWMHYTRADLDALYAQDGTYHYQLVTRCPYARTAQCYSPEWQVIENQNSINGRRHSAARSVQECLDYCGGQRGCLAADVNLGERPPTCWVHFFAAYKTNAYSQPGTNQYRLTNRCAADPITETTTAPTTTETTTPLDMNTCRKSLWLHRRGYTAQGGSHYVGPRTIQQCLDHCNDTASCVAVDIDVDVVPLRCWMHNNKDDLRSDNIFTQPGTDHYQLITRCPNARTGSGCYNPEWEVIENSNAVGATQYAEAQSVQECLDHCGRRDDCVAADVDLTQRPPTCYPHFNSDDLKTIYKQPGTNQYRRVEKCTQNPVTVVTEPTTTALDPRTCRRSAWSSQRDRTADGGKHHVGPRTIQQCLHLCDDTPSCVAVDIDVNHVPLRCWMHNNKDDLRSDNIFTQNGTDHYQLITRCPNAREASDYNPEWEMIESRTSVGASRYKEAQSVQECLDQCVKQPRCVAADVDLNIHPPTCWLHFNLSALSNIYSQPGINQYRLTDRHADGPITVPTTTTTVPIAIECGEAEWEIYENRSSSGAWPYMHAKNVEECLDFCVANTYCAGVDIDKRNNPPTCWPHFSAAQMRNGVDLNTTGVDQYILLKRCSRHDGYSLDVVIGLAVGLGVPLLLLIVVIVLLLLCCVLGRREDGSGERVEAINRFAIFQFPTWKSRGTRRDGGDTVKSTTSGYAPQHDNESSVYDTPTTLSTNSSNDASAAE